jgi:hypothetical protein
VRGTGEGLNSGARCTKKKRTWRVFFVAWGT